MHRIGADGEAETRRDAFVDAYAGTAGKARRLAIRKPDDGAVFRLIGSLPSQRIVCTVAGNVENGRLWWFVDGKAAGETVGSQKFAWPPELGAHRISCSTADGVSASVSVTVVAD